MGKPVIPSINDLKKKITKLSARPDKLRDYLDTIIPFLRGPSIDDFSPREACPGSMIEIRGKNFALIRDFNEVTVGRKPAIIVGATSTKLKVITDPLTTDGFVKVKVGTKSATSLDQFKVKPYPKPGSNEDGPPIFFAGTGSGHAGDVPGIGTLNVLVVLVNPTDRVPANPAQARNDVVTAWDTVHTFYDQASYTRLDVHVDVTANWHTLLDNFNHYVTIAAGDPDAPNIRNDVLDQLMAEAAQFAQNDGYNLDNYAVMACVINLNGTFIRAWGGWSRNNFSFFRINSIFPPDITWINISVNHDLNLLAIQESANWGVSPMSSATTSYQCLHPFPPRRELPRSVRTSIPAI